ncbi:hypothetical protein [Tuberibacillus sp. Marseille-P3662]|uniref:hypothetical protein n=1 Tax=Tuberibacillus sp. Marseille-P3662 TaxID=1965358 RepID=UPI000A1CC174|nr:hypothetical protein [Tuberibacillus sp. Marseille-P3662]
MPEVTRRFRDKNTMDIYNVGDTFKSDDYKRVAFLVDRGFLEGSKQTTQYPKHVGGGWYELSDGEKVQGKDEAQEAEKALNNDA